MNDQEPDPALGSGSSLQCSAPAEWSASAGALDSWIGSQGDVIQAPLQELTINAKPGVQHPHQSK